MTTRGFLLILIFLVRVVGAQTPDELREQILALYADRDYLTAATLLTKLENDDRDAFRANNYDYLLARIEERLGDTAAAAAHFQDVANRRSVLREYALWHLARIARSSGNLLFERLLLAELASFSPDSLLAFPAERRLAESWLDGGNYDLAIAQLERHPARNDPNAPIDVRDSRERQSLLAEAYIRAGNHAKARELFTDLVTGIPDPAQPDDAALDAVRGLDTIDSTRSGPPSIDDREHLRRANIYQFNREFENARLHYMAVINDFRGSELAPEATFHIGRGYAMMLDHTEAVQWFERILEQFPEHPIAAEAQLYAASSYARVGKYREAVYRYKAYIEKFPEGERVDRAYLNVIDVLRDQREEIEALKWADTLRSKFQGRQPAALATFAEVRIHLARTNWERALEALDRLEKYSDLGGASVPGGTTRAEIRFLRGYAIEQLRRYPEAIDVYLSIPDGSNEYFGWRSTERLRALAIHPNAKQFIEAKSAELKSQKSSDPDSTRRNIQSLVRLTDSLDEKKKLLAQLRTIYATLPAYSVAKVRPVKNGRQAVSKRTKAGSRTASTGDELLFLGLYDEAAPEMESKAKNASSSRDLDYTIAAFYTRGDLPDRGAAFAESFWKLPADYQIELIPADALELLYPAPFSDLLLRHAPQRNMDPRFLLSIMRQESRFRADARSDAAARGLMQFISTTANRVAAELGREDFQQEDLYDPSTAILFGSHYTGNLLKQFPNETEAVVASYNGGDDNMRRWLARAKSDQPDQYVSEIMYAQTKGYVERVMCNYRMYSALYDEGLKRK